MNNSESGFGMVIVFFVLICAVFGWPGERAKKEREQQAITNKVEILWQQHTNTKANP